MTYLLIGNESLIKKQIKELITKEKINNLSVATYDLKEQSIKDAICDINTIDIFNTKKAVIIKNIKELKEDKMLIDYLDNENDNLLIITSNEKLDERKKLTKKLSEKNVIDLNNYDLEKYTKEELKDYKISILDIKLLIDYCGNSYDNLKTEIEKLKMYKYETKEITQEDIKKVVRKSFDMNIFDLINNINGKNKKEVFKILNGLLDQKEDEIKILVILANNYRLLFQIKELTKEKTDQEIIKLYNMNPYRLKKLKEQARLYTKDEILKIMKDLADIDFAIKSGKTDKNTALKLFLANV